MHELSQRILSDFQIRKTKAQKDAFIRLLQQYMPDLRVEKAGAFGSRNLILGDITRARILFSAHYDTCAALPFPNLILPLNLPLTVLYSLLLCIPFFALGGVCGVLLSFVSDSFFLSYWISLAVVLAAFVLVFFLGRPNRHTANDNTSGVVLLCELIPLLAGRDDVAFVFFDNEENGILGSSAFRRRHKAELNHLLLFNFDCVSDGDHILLVQNGRAQRDYGGMLQAAFPDAEGKTVHAVSSGRAFYPSDQMGFPCSVAAAALKHSRIAGLYMDRIHTSRDTVFDESNLRYFTESAVRFVG